LGPARKKSRTEGEDQKASPKKEAGAGAMGGGVRRLLWRRRRT
jgi:hypothetical protein